jgi:pimeloyl-ACP methyl ester carboxylesterase
VAPALTCRTCCPWPTGWNASFISSSTTSEAPCDRATPDSIAARPVADLEDLRETLGAERIRLVSQSFGTMLAFAYLTEHPDRVANLVLVGALPHKKQGGIAACPDSPGRRRHVPRRARARVPARGGQPGGCPPHPSIHELRVRCRSVARQPSFPRDGHQRRVRPYRRPTWKSALASPCGNDGTEHQRDRDSGDALVRDPCRPRALS